MRPLLICQRVRHPVHNLLYLGQHLFFISQLLNNFILLKFDHILYGIDEHLLLRLIQCLECLLERVQFLEVKVLTI